MTRLLALILALSIAGCVGPARFRGWQDPPHKFTACHGAPNGVAACFQQAQAMCPQGYQLAEMRSDPAINRHSIVVVCAGLPPAPTPPRNAVLAPVTAPPPPPVK